MYLTALHTTEVKELHLSKLHSTARKGQEVLLTFLVGKCTESAPGAIASVLDVVTLGRLVNLRVKLLLRSEN